MPDTLTTDNIAQILIDARRTSYTLRPGGEKRVTLTLARVEMLCREVLRLRAERDAAIAEAVRGERERCLAILGSNEFWDSVEDAIRRGE